MVSGTVVQWVHVHKVHVHKEHVQWVHVYKVHVHKVHVQWVHVQKVTGLKKSTLAARPKDAAIKRRWPSGLDLVRCSGEG